MAIPKTSKDVGYEIGGLSNFPDGLDSRELLYPAENNAETILESPLKPFSTLAVLKDGTNFPVKSGVIRISNEFIHYEHRDGQHLFGMTRGFAGSSPAHHFAGSTVLAPCMADMHNALRDAIIRLQQKVGLKSDEPSVDIEAGATLRARALFLDNKWFNPRSLFFSFNRIGRSPLGVQFVDFSYGEPLRWVWEFGDGSMSVDQHPYHIYHSPGKYDVTLTIFTSRNNGVSSKVKRGYVEVLDDDSIGDILFYAQRVNPIDETTEDIMTGPSPLTMRFFDQTQGNIVSRIWSFGDGTTVSVDDPFTYWVDHTYTRIGKFTPSLIVSDGSSTFKRDFSRQIEVLS